MKTVQDLITELMQYPSDMPVIVPADDGRALGFTPVLRVVYERGELEGHPSFRSQAPGTPLLLIDLPITD